MIDNPYESYPWESNPRDEYEIEVREAIEKEMYDYDITYIDWLNDFEYLPANQSIMDITTLHQFCDILNEIDIVKDGYYNFREYDVLNKIIKNRS